jgi:mono/diheme cytochrome c family protein
MNMSRRTRVLIAASVALAVAALAMISSPVAISQQPTSLREAGQIFQARCSTCHAEHGEGSEVGASLNVPDLRSKRIQQDEDNKLRQIIREGKGDMPMFKRDFSDNEINQLIKLVRSFAQQGDNAKAHESSNERGSKDNWRPAPTALFVNWQHPPLLLPPLQAVCHSSRRKRIRR